MLLRKCQRTKDGTRHAYFALVESQRTERGPRPRIQTVCGCAALLRSLRSFWGEKFSERVCALCRVSTRADRLRSLLFNINVGAWQRSKEGRKSCWINRLGRTALVRAIVGSAAQRSSGSIVVLFGRGELPPLDPHR